MEREQFVKAVSKTNKALERINAGLCSEMTIVEFHKANTENGNATTSDYAQTAGYAAFQLLTAGFRATIMATFGREMFSDREVTGRERAVAAIDALTLGLRPKLPGGLRFASEIVDAARFLTSQRPKTTQTPHE